MQYLKDMWKISGKLKWYEYITFGSLLYGLIIIFAFIYTLVNMTLNLRNILEIPLVLIIYGGIGYLNIRFNPFISQPLKTFFSNIGKKTKQNVKDSYREEIEKGPKTTVSKVNPFSSADATLERSVIGNHYKLKSNWETKTESDLDVKARALNQAVVSGLGTPVFESFAGFIFTLIKWPFSFLLAIIKMRPIIKKYRAQIEENNSVEVPQTSQEENIKVTDKVFSRKKYCTNCGSKVEEGQNFCTSCGNKVI